MQHGESLLPAPAAHHGQHPQLCSLGRHSTAPSLQHSPLASLETEQAQSFVTTATRRCVCLFSLWTARTDTCGLQQCTWGRGAHFTHLDGWKQQAAKTHPPLKQEFSQFLIPRLPTQCGFWSNLKVYRQSLSPLSGCGT